MRKAVLREPIENEITIPFKDLIYPGGDPAMFNGKSFGLKKLDCSVQFKTCIQIAEGVEIKKLDYFYWTIEKLERFGEKYERFLFSPSKGCGLTQNMYYDILSLTDLNQRRIKIATLSTNKFIELYYSVMNNWDPRIRTKEILFYKLAFNRFTIIEGLHRLNILYYKYSKANYNAFITDNKNIKKGYYYNQLRQYIRTLIKKEPRHFTK